jgi:two-component system sensor histidine kinase QseC
MTSIRRQLLNRSLLAFGLLLIGGLAAIYLLVRVALVKSFDRALLAKAQAVSTLVMLDGDEVTLSFSDKFMRGFDDEAAKEFYEVRRADGTSAQRSESLGNAHLPDKTGTFVHPRIWWLTLPDGKPGRALGVEFVPRGQTKAATRANLEVFHLVLAANSEDLTEDLREILVVITVSGALLLGLTAMLVPRVLNAGLRPLTNLADEVETIGSETLAKRFPVTGAPRELQVISDRLNALLDRLESAFDRERRVTAALAHELRTPIAELRHLADRALKWPESRDPDTDRETKAIATQMEALVVHMLTLARGENGQLSPQLQILDLGQAVTEAWKPRAETVTGKERRVNLPTEPIMVSADPVLLSSILVNLLENAAEYCPAGGVIETDLVCTPAGASLRIANTVTNLTDEDVAHFFERFWRKEQARSGGSHVGLGLSLVKTFVRALGWEITARLEDRSRLVMELTCPTATSLGPDAAV